MASLDVYYFSGDNRADEPATVDNDIALDDVITDILANPQPHPTLVYARDRPTIRPAELPDQQFKFDLDTEYYLAAVHLFGPRDLLPADMTGEADDTTAWIALPRQPDTPVPTGVTLYIDRDTRTEFPREAALPLSASQSSAQVHADRQTSHMCRLAATDIFSDNATPRAR